MSSLRDRFLSESLPANLLPLQIGYWVCYLVVDANGKPSWYRGQVSAIDQAGVEIDRGVKRLGWDEVFVPF